MISNCFRRISWKRSGDRPIADKESSVVLPNYDYPKKYLQPKPIAEQVHIIAKLFNLEQTHALEFVKNLSKLPESAEGWFAIPKVSAIIKRRFPAIIDSAEQNCEAIKLVHKKLEESRIFYNLRENEIIPTKIRQHTRTTEFMEKLEVEQRGDILIIAAQYGRLYRGKSVYESRENFAKNEFGLGTFAIGCMTLIHPERFFRWKDLNTDCVGDEFAPNADGNFWKSPFFRLAYEGLEFGTSDTLSSDQGYGSVTCFL